MKQMLLIFLSASALCVMSTSIIYEKYSNELEKDRNLMKSFDESRSYKINKRYADKQAECQATILDELCNNGYYQEYTNLLHSCDAPIYVANHQAMCTPNSMGGYCDAYIAHRYYLSYKRNCNNSSSTCSRECEDVLAFSRYALGCCISSIFNNTKFEASDFLYYPEMFSYSLWSSCSVRPVTQECPPSTVTTPSVQRDPTCNITDDIYAFLQLYYLTNCKRRYIESTMSRISHVEGCSDYFHNYYDLFECKVNHFGTYCSGISYNQYENLYSSASIRCSDNILSCEDVCREALQNITDTVGCCFSDYYITGRGSRTQEWLNRDFWSMCKVEYPGSCQPKYTDEEILVATVASSGLVPTIIGSVITITVIVTTAIIMTVIVVIITKKRSGRKAIQDHFKAATPQDTGHVQEHDCSEPGEPMYDCIRDRQEFELKENVAYGTAKRQSE